MTKKMITAVMVFLFMWPWQIAAWADQQIPGAMAQPTKFADSQAFANGVARTKKVHFPNGDIYWMKRIEFTADKPEPYTVAIPLAGKNGMFRFADRQNETNTWPTVPLSGSLPQQSGFLQTNSRNMLLNATNFFVQKSHGTIEEQPNPLPVQVTETAEGYLISVQVPQKKMMIAEIWGVESSHPLVDWNSSPDLENFWLTIDLQMNSKWSWDGYYVRVPKTYTPYSPTMFWRLPTNYAAHWFLTMGGGRAADDLSWVMLDTILPNQNADGYWETLPRSEWLWKDYQIGAGFYDTRFNTDIAMLLLKGYQKYGSQSFLQAAERYSYYLLKHMENNHYKNYGTAEGWLVADYAWKQPHKKTHVSLNHQLQEMNFLYHMYLQTDQIFYKEFADLLLYGIKNSADRWIKPDLDLHYAYLNNGSMGLSDYPFLTYNDLVEAQSVMLQIYEMADPDIDELMASKKQWMDQTGVKGYRMLPFMEFSL